MIIEYRVNPVVRELVSETSRLTVEAAALHNAGDSHAALKVLARSNQLLFEHVARKLVVTTNE